MYDVLAMPRLEFPKAFYCLCSEMSGLAAIKP
jgi:hypothetical protein